MFLTNRKKKMPEHMHKYRDRPFPPIRHLMDRFPVKLDVDDDDDDDDNNETFTRAQVDSIVKKAVKELNGQLRELTQKVEESDTGRKEMEDLLIQAAGGEDAIEHFMETGQLPDDDGGDYDEDDDDDSGGQVFVDEDGNQFGIVGADDMESYVKGLNTRHQRQMEAINRKLEKEIAERQELEKGRLHDERDRLLSDALIKNDVVDVKAGLKLFRDSMEYDEDERAWKFKSDEGLYMEPTSGLAEALPDFLRKTMTGPGGSGSRGSSPGVVQGQLQNKKKELADLASRAKSSGDARDIGQWQKLNREVKELEAESSGAATTG